MNVSMYWVYMGTRGPKPLQFIGQFLSRNQISQGYQGKQRHNEHLKMHIYNKGIIMLNMVLEILFRKF